MYFAFLEGMHVSKEKEIVRVSEMEREERYIR